MSETNTTNKVVVASSRGQLTHTETTKMHTSIPIQPRSYINIPTSSTFTAENVLAEKLQVVRVLAHPGRRNIQRTQEIEKQH